MFTNRSDSIIQHGKKNCDLYKENDRYMIFHCEDGYKGSEKSMILEPKNAVFSLRKDVGKKKTKKVIKDIGGFKKYIKPDDKVYIKIAFSNIAPSPDPRILEQIVKESRKIGADVAILDSESSEKDLNTKTMVKNGYFKILKKLDIPLYNIKDIEKVEFSRENSRFSLPLSLFEDNAKLISIATLKHDLVSGVSLGTKNLLDLVETNDRYDFDVDEFISDVHKLIPPDLTIIDASNSCLSAYPLFCEEGDKNFLIASNDSICADAWGARMSFYPLDRVQHLMRSESIGNGNTKCRRAKKSTNPLEVANKKWKEKVPSIKIVDTFSSAHELLGRSIGAKMADSFWTGSIIPILDKARNI